MPPVPTIAARIAESFRAGCADPLSLSELESRLGRHFLEVPIAELGVDDLCRLGWILLGLDDEPTLVLRRVKLRQKSREVDAAVAGDGKDARKNSIHEAHIGCSRRRQDRPSHILAVKVIHPADMPAEQRHGIYAGTTAMARVEQQPHR